MTARPGAVRVRKRDGAEANKVLAPHDVAFEFLQADGTWLECTFVTGLRVSIQPEKIPMATLTVLLHDIGLEFANPDQIALVQDFRERLKDEI